MKEIQLDTKPPLVSITIPTNNGKFLQGALNSLITQVFNDVEIIVINDGGGDGIDKIIESFSFYRNLRYYKKENGGTASAINLGHALSRGKYLSWCSDDNVYFDRYIDCFVQAFQAIEASGADIGLIYSDFVFLNERGQVISQVTHNEPQTGADLVEGYDVGMSFMYTKELFAKTGPYINRICEDFNWVVRAAQHTKFGLIKNVLAGFRVHGGQLTGSNKTEEKAAADDAKALAAHYFMGAEAPENKDEMETREGPGWVDGDFVGLESYAS
jgi:glycosyltransferase involved in cell wall biosynthesis